MNGVARGNTDARLVEIARQTVETISQWETALDDQAVENLRSAIYAEFSRVARDELHKVQALYEPVRIVLFALARTWDAKVKADEERRNGWASIAFQVARLVELELGEAAT